MIELLDRIGDELGPEKILLIQNPAVGLKGVLVIDNTARGLGKGGLRIAPSVTVEIVARLARSMTYKLAMADIPWGGAKAGIVAASDTADKERLIRAFARAIKEYVPDKYIIGIDMGVTEDEIAVAVDELDDLRAATGKPEFMGGIPPYKLGITGFGLAEAARVALERCDSDLQGATVVVQGCGWVGKSSARNLARQGAKIIALSDTTGVAYNEAGLDVDELLRLKASGGCLASHGGDVLQPGEELSLPADLLVLAAKEDVIGAHNVDAVKPRVIVEGANLPVPPAIEEELETRGVMIVPDFVANFGGALAAWTESIGGTEQQAFELTRVRVSRAAEEVLELSNARGIPSREAALSVAKGRVLHAMKARGRLPDD